MRLDAITKPFSLSGAAEGGVATPVGLVGLPESCRHDSREAAAKSDGEYRVAVGRRRADRLSAQENRQS